MGSSDVAPAEDTVQALLDYLVDPTLRVKSSDSPPSLSQQQLVATQVHAAVLLYNYYHRKEKPQLEYLGFDSFCKLAGILKPNLIAHLKLMQVSSDTVVDDEAKQLSITEKAIMDACDISQSLDASKDVPNTEGWPISRVSVFLIDSKKENCLLLFSSITQGVWSLIEKDVDINNDSYEGMTEAKYISKRKRIIKKSTRDESNVGEAGFQQLAYSAVKGLTAISQSDLSVMESHVVYSLSKEKTAARFYIMQCAESINEEIIQVPIKDMIDSLQGPLVVQSSFGWMVTPVVEYFHVLPYAGILKDWFSREVLSDSLKASNLGLENVNVDGYQETEKPSNTLVERVGDKSHEKSGAVDTRTNGTTTEPLKQKDDNGYCTPALSTAFNGPKNMHEDEASIDKYQEQNTTPIEGDLDIAAGMVDSMKPPVTDCNGEKLITRNGLCNVKSADQDENPTGDHVLNSCQTMTSAPDSLGNKMCVDQDQKPVGDSIPVTYSKTRSHDKLRSNVDRKDNVLSQTAVRVLLRKIDKLRHQQRAIEEEIAQCDKTILTILAGSEDDVALKIESIVEGCGVVSLATLSQTENSTCQLSDGPLCVKRKRLSEAVLTMQNPCQELDSICYENNWILPIYRVLENDGGFQADIVVKGVDFEYSIASELHASPCEARESVAAQMLAKLRAKKHEK